MAERDRPKPSLDDSPPAPPEQQVRPALAGIVKSREMADQGGALPGLGGPNMIAERAMEAEKALAALAQALPDPAPVGDVIARLRAAVLAALQSSGQTQQPGAPGGLSTIVAPPGPIQPPPMGGVGMPPPPVM